MPNITTTFQPTVLITVSDAEYMGLLKQGLVATVQDGPPIDRPDFTEEQYAEFLDPSTKAGQAIRIAAASAVSSVLAPAARIDTLDNDTGLSYAVVFEDPDTKVWTLQYGVRDDGTIYSPTATGSSTAVPLVPGPDIVWPGDSLSAGAGGGGTTAPGTLQSTMVANGKAGTVRNLGIGGEQSPDIAARYAGGTLLALPDGGVWPASGSVNVAITSDEKVATTSFIRQGNVGLNPATINGVPGTWTIAWDATNTVYTATRIGTGAATVAGRPRQIISAASKDRAGDVLVMWPGRNNATATARVLSDVATMALHQRAATDRFLVLGVLNGVGEGAGSGGVYTAIVNLNNTEKQLYGRRFIDIRRYLIDYGLSDAGITPTTQDQADVTADIVPTSLRSDGLHLNAAGYTLVGKFVYDRLVEMGWL